MSSVCVLRSAILHYKISRPSGHRDGSHADSTQAARVLSRPHVVLFTIPAFPAPLALGIFSTHWQGHTPTQCFDTMLPPTPPTPQPSQPPPLHTCSKFWMDIRLGARRSAAYVATHCRLVAYVATHCFNLPGSWVPTLVDHHHHHRDRGLRGRRTSAVLLTACKHIPTLVPHLYLSPHVHAAVVLPVPIPIAIMIVEVARGTVRLVHAPTRRPPLAAHLARSAMRAPTLAPITLTLAPMLTLALIPVLTLSLSLTLTSDLGGGGRCPATRRA